MKRRATSILALLALWTTPLAVASIGDDPQAILDGLSERGFAVVAQEDAYLVVLDAEGQPFRFSFEERGGRVFRVHGEGRVAAVEGDSSAAFAAELIGLSTVYGDQLTGPVKNFFETRVGDLAWQGEVNLGVEEYLLTLEVMGSGPFDVVFSLALQEIPRGSFPAAPHVLGSADARYVIREFSDFQCPFCANFNRATLPAIEAAIASADGVWSEVRFEFHHFPLQTIHANASIAAEAAECVSAANTPEAFWAFHDALFERQQAWQDLADPSSYFVRLAQDVGLSGDGVATCLTSRQFAPAIDAAYQLAESELRLTGTPTIFVNGYKVRNYLELDSYLELFDLIDAFAQE